MTLEIGSYEEAVAAHEWRVPERYNIAVDCCDKHPADKLAMIHEDFEGNVREVTWGELQEWSNRFANVLRAHGVERGDRVAMLLPPTPETAAAFFGTWKAGAILLSMSVLYGDDGIRHRIDDSEPKVLVTDAANAGRVARRPGADPRRRPAGDRRPVVRRRRHRRRRPGAALLLLRHHRPGEGHPARAPLPARARGVRLLPRGAGRRAVPRHGRVGVGGRDRAAARAVAARRGADGLPAQGRLRPAQAARRALAPRRHERVHDADGDALDDVDRRRRHALPAEVPARVLGRRAAEPRGDPLVPRAVRAHGARLLRPHRVLSAGRQLPVHGGPRGLDGQADAGLGRRDPRRGRAAGAAGRARRDLPARALEPALSARLLAQRRGRQGDVRRRVVPLQGRGALRRGRLRLVRGPRRRRDHRRRATGSGRSRSSPPASSTRRSPRPRPSRRPTSAAATS